MKKTIIFTALSFFLFSGTYIKAQTEPEVDSRLILQKGLAYHEDKKYNEAIAEYQKVHRNDTNYVLALVEQVFSFMANEQDSLAVEACNLALERPSTYYPIALLYKGNALDKLKKYDEAIHCYKEGMEKYPNYNMFYYEYGVLMYNRDKFKEAHDLITESIRLNPYHANSHFIMGNLAIKQGKLIPAILAYQFYLLLDNSSARAHYLVSELEKLVTIQYEFKDAVKVDGLSKQDDFAEVESLVRSKIALNAKYKSLTKLKYNITKQIQLICEKTVVNKKDEGFYMQFYAPILSEQFKRKYFAPYSYALLAGMDIKDVNSWRKKNTKITDEWVTWFNNYMSEHYTTFDVNLNGKTVKARHWYGDGNKLTAIGNINEEGNRDGYWMYYYGTGILKTEGAYNSKGERTSDWKFYDDAGNITDIERYDNGKLNGISKGYYSNGSVSYESNYVNGTREGNRIVYYPTGVKRVEYQYTNGKKNGKEIFYYPNGKVKYEINNVNDIYQGDLVQYHENGSLKEKTSFKDDNRNGNEEEYYEYPEKQIKVTAVYEEGHYVGEWKSYHTNGKVAEIGNYDKDGNQTGVWKSFYDDGTLASEETLSKGKFDGTLKYYASSGEQTEEFTYKNNILQEYKAFDVTGKVIFQNKKDGKNDYDLVLYHPNGNKRKEGKIIDGKNSGVWVEYDLDGFKNYEVTYKDGLKDGKSTFFYETGKVKNEMIYSEGQTNGYYTEYFKDGTTKRKGAYINDQMDGEWTSYYANGNKYSDVFYKDGEMDGWQSYYAVNGKLDFEDFLELGLFRKRVSYDSTGKAFEKIIFDKGSVMFNTVYPNGNKHINCEFKNNLKQGDYKAYYGNGKLLIEKKYIDDNIDGKSTDYYLNGKTKSVYNYIYGNLHGTQLVYFEEGGVYSETEYVYGESTGKVNYYYPNHKLQSTYTQKEANVHGKRTIYDDLTGEVLLERTYKNGYLLNYTFKDVNGKLVTPIEVKNETGKIKAYFPSGKTSVEYSMKYGFIDGKRTEYYSNGNVRDVYDYIAGDLNGVGKEYYSSGKIKSEINYLHDERNGTSTYYYENGKISKEEHYLNDERHGISKYYDENGKLIHTYVFYNGDMINEL